MTLPPDWDDFEAKLTVELIAIAKCSNAQARPFATQAAFLRAFLFAIDPVLDVRDAAARERAAQRASAIMEEFAAGENGHAVAARLH